MAAAFHAEFFGEHPDNVLFANLVKCLLAKIFDERQTANGQKYQFQILVKINKEESADDIFARVNKLYNQAYQRFIDSSGDPDEISSRDFSPERVKTVVRNIQSMSLTKGAAVHGDIIGAFFEEILRSGFKQDKGMYFTHTNLIQFILNAIDIEGLTVKTWKNSNHPENRLPYIIDPACGSGAFLLAAMNSITRTIRENKNDLVSNLDEENFFLMRECLTKSPTIGPKTLSMEWIPSS